MFKTFLERMVADNYNMIFRANKTPVGKYERSFNANQVNEFSVVIVDSEYRHNDIIIQR